jgi:hypothetical protein
MIAIFPLWTSFNTTLSWVQGHAAVMHATMQMVDTLILWTVTWHPLFFAALTNISYTSENFPFICSNIPAAPAYEVFISQLIRYSRACGSYQDFLHRGLLLTSNLLNQGFILIKLKSSLRKFYGRHQTGDEPRSSRKVSSSRSTSDTRRVNLVTNPVISHERGKCLRQVEHILGHLWQVCFIPWPTPRNWQWRTFHSYVATFQQHLHMEYISLSW